MKQRNTYDNCNCLSDCKSTTLNVFEMRQSLEPNRYFYDSLIKDYANFTWKNHKMWFLINTLKGHLPDEKFNREENIHNYLLSNHVAIVKIEIVTTSMMRSIRDKRYPFEVQLASLGPQV